MATAGIDIDNAMDLEAVIREHWPRVSNMLAISLAQQQPSERAELYRMLDEGHGIEWLLDEDRGVVVFGVSGMGFCEMSYAALTGIPATTTRH